MARKQFLAFVILIVASFFPAAQAEFVTPVPSVTAGLNVRELPSTDQTAVVGKLRPGERAEVVESVPYWFKVTLPDGTQGFVSKRWVKLIAEGTALATVTPFTLHVVDVGIGDGFILDMGDREVLVDGGMSTKPLRDYAGQNQVIKDPVELAIVTHADADHWKGMSALLKLDAPAPAFRVLEFWEPGYDRPCNSLPSYDAFIAGMQRIVPAAKFRRPLQATHIPTSTSHVLEPFEVPALPGVRFTVLHSEQQPDGPNCAYQINNASIVLRVEVGGVVMLWTGDTNGKLREDEPDVAPAFIEGKLLEIERQHPGTLKADILKVAHHGSETANTAAFISAVNPRFAIISASTNHSLPKPTVVRRYEDAGAVVLKTDVSRKSGDDPIMCVGSGTGDVDCNYADQFE